jgi:hypothetical protein
MHLKRIGRTAHTHRICIMANCPAFVTYDPRELASIIILLEVFALTTDETQSSLDLEPTNAIYYGPRNGLKAGVRTKQPSSGTS